MIAWNRVEELKDEIGEEDFGEVVVLFLEEVEEVIDRLRDRIDPDTLASDLHFLKGSALNLGFRSFANLCQQGESAARDPAADTAIVDQVIKSYKESKVEFLGQASGRG